MNKLLPAAIKILLLAMLAFGFPFARAYAAPSVLFDKTSVSVAQNGTFNVTVNLNVDAYTAQSSKVTVKYAPADLEVMQVASGNFFPSFSQANDPGTGTLEITGYTTAAGSGSTANGNLATITFKAKKGSGSSSLTFACGGGGHDTNMLTTTGQNIFLSCNPINTLGASYTGSGVPTPTPTPPGPTPTPQTSGGNTIPYCASLTSDVATGVGSPLAVTFSCAGVDPDGFLGAAEFTFGDGTKQLVEKNAGSPGSISTTHTYTTIGTLGASCRVRDNNQIFSPVPDVCRRIITIRPGPTSAPIRTSRVSALAAPNPTPQVVTIVSETPEATPTAEAAPVPEETTVVQSAKRELPWLLIGAVGLIGLGTLLYIFGKKKNPPQDLP